METRKLIGQIFGTRIYVIGMPDGSWSIQEESAESHHWEWYRGFGGSLLWWPTEDQAVEAARLHIQREGR